MAHPIDLDIDRVAQLARLALTSEEKAKFSQQLGEVLHHIRQLEQVDVSNVEPTAHAFPLFNVWAEDVVKPGLLVDAALRNAPAQRDNMIAVPKVVELSLWSTNCFTNPLPHCRTVWQRKRSRQLNLPMR